MRYTTEATTVYEELSKPFPAQVLGSVSKGGAKLTYVPIAEVKARLNMVLGVDGWEDQSEVFASPTNPDWIISNVTLTLLLLNDDGHIVRIPKEGWGGTKVKLSKGAPLDLGDEYKGAHSDAFKKAATSHGVGLDIARKDDALALEASERLANVPKATSETLTAIRDVVGALDENKTTEFKQWWKETIGVKMDSGSVTEDQGADALAYVTGLSSE